MPSDKDRIYIALYARGGKPTMPGLEDKYHWAIVIGPKTENRDAEGKLYHARERMTIVDNQPQSIWEFEERTTSMSPTAMILARILIGKVVDITRLESLVRNTQIRGTQPGWNCVAWVKEVLEKLEADGKALGTSVTDWSQIREAAMRYVEWKKTQHRYDGQGQFDLSKVATWSLLEGKEVVG